MTCREAKRHISAYHDGELNAELRAATADHLASCPACQAQLQAITELSETLKRGRDCQVPAGLWDRIQASAGTSQRRRRVRGWAARIGAIAAGFAIFLLGHSALRPSPFVDNTAPIRPATPVDQALRDTGLVLAGQALTDDRLASLSSRPEVILVQRLTEGNGP